MSILRVMVEECILRESPGACMNGTIRLMVRPVNKASQPTIRSIY